MGKHLMVKDWSQNNGGGQADRVIGRRQQRISLERAIEKNIRGGW